MVRSAIDGTHTKPYHQKHHQFYLLVSAYRCLMMPDKKQKAPNNQGFTRFYCLAVRDVARSNFTPTQSSLAACC